jgi:arylsulfatase A
MPPSRLLSTIAALLTVVTALQAADPRPNLVFILADDLGYGELSCFGQQRFATPHIDRLAREGITLTDHYAGSPICAPARNSLMTGEHTGHLTVRNNFLHSAEFGPRIPLKSTDLTLAQFLRDAGYVTGMVGKWGLGEEGSGAEPWNKGWDFFYGFVNQRQAHNHYPEFLYRNRDKEALVPNYAHHRGVFANDRFTDEALDFIERQRGSSAPFFLYVAYTTPHAWLMCPDDSIAEAKARHPHLAAPGVPETALVFAAMVLRLDRDVGRLMAKLKDEGLDERTLVIFTSDNGPHAEDGKDNAYFNAAGPLRGIKRDLYEGGTRVPFIARWPGRIAPGTRSAHVSAFWDFPATALEAAGARSPRLPADGISYLPTLLGRPEEQRQHDHLYWELVFKGQARQAIRQGNWKAVRYGLEAPTEVYDLSRDVGERHNLAARHPELVRKFEAMFTTSRTEDPNFPLRMNP